MVPHSKLPPAALALRGAGASGTGGVYQREVGKSFRTRVPAASSSAGPGGEPTPWSRGCAIRDTVNIMGCGARGLAQVLP